MRLFTYRPPPGQLDVIYQDNDYIAINKPSGLLSNPGRAEHTLDCALTRMQKQSREILLIHRLDCDTSGILIFAKHKKAESALKKQFQERQIKKSYSALVWGVPAKSNDRISAALAADPENSPLQMVNPQGKEALTDYSILQKNHDENCALLRLTPLTGRTHQLRVHLNHIGHPILGDSFYGHSDSCTARPRLCLHADNLEFSHPFSGERITITLPAAF